MRILTYASLLLTIVASIWQLQRGDEFLDNHVLTTSNQTVVAASSIVPQFTTRGAKIIEEAPNANNLQSALMVDTTIYTIPDGRTDSLGITLPNCEDIFYFKSDGTPVYNDQPDSTRNNIISICPPTHGRKLLVTFAEFNLSFGDELRVFDGPDTLSPIIVAGATGDGVPQVNGGWVISNCNPSVNPTGCLTFNFQTNGDGNAGLGWEAIISCLPDSVTTFKPKTDIRIEADCETLTSTFTLTVPGLDIPDNGLCTIAEDSDVLVEFCGQDLNGQPVSLHKDTLKTNADTLLTLTYGIYSVKYTLLADPSIITNCFISIAAPNLICNDTIQAAIGQGCKTFLSPDDILESFEDCPVISSGPLTQTYEVRARTDTGFVLVTAQNPLDAKAGGNIGCNNFHDIFVTRVITDCTSGTCRQAFRDSCRVTVKFVDGIKPIFVGVRNDTIGVDTFYGCQDIQINADMLRRPTIIDNCDLASLEVIVPEIVLGACDTNKTFFAKWVATDLCGNSAFAFQKLLVRRPNAQNLYAPRDTMINCNVSTSPAITGWPRLDTNGDGIPDINLVTDGGEICFLDVVFRDDTIPNCGNSIDIIRYWSLRNFCANEQSVMPADTQVISLIDTIGPTIFKPGIGVIGSETNPYVFENGHIGCDGIPGTIPIPGGLDSCDQDFTTRLVGLFPEQGSPDLFPDLTAAIPIGKYSAAYVHIDACDNRSDTCHIYFEIKDLTSPTPICTDELRVSMTSGNFPIRPQDIDDGTKDNCGIEHLFIRRSVCGNINIFEDEVNEFILDTYGGRIPFNGWANFIEVGCCDINELVRVQLLAIDKAGNHNFCWVNIFPEDHLQPVCAILPDTIAFCDEYHTDVFGAQTDHNHNQNFDEQEWLPVDAERAILFNETFGNPVCKDNISCNEIIVEQEYQLVIGLCGEQRIKRRYRSVDFHDNGNVSVWYEQNIHVQYRAGWSVTFPPDTTFQCGSVVPEFPLVVGSGLCDLIRWEYKDEIFSGTGGGCYKVFRRWQISNSCQLVNGQSIFPLPRDIREDSRVTHQSDRTFTAQDTIEGEIIGDYGQLAYTQIIKVTDSQAPIITISRESDCIIGGTDCTELHIFSISAEDCTFNTDITFNYQLFESGILVVSGTGTQVEYAVSPFETYTLQVEAFDNCGNSSKEEETYLFRDCDPPVVICNGNNLNIDLTADKQVSVPATWLNGNSFDNCDTDLNYRIWHKSVSNIPPASFGEVALLPTSIFMGCGDVGQSAVILFVFDASNNFASCSTNITIQDSENHCALGRSAKISGTVSTLEGNKVEGVEMYITDTNAASTMQMTGIDGTFSFETATGVDYLLTPRKNVEVLNGVSTLDLVIMQKHILGIQSFDSPYKYIAADVNKSGTITAYDLVQVRQVILDILPDFPNNESWRFVNAAYSMNEANPLEGFQENFRIWEATEDTTIDFIGVKIGDVTGNALTNSLMQAEPRSNVSPIQLQVQDQVIEAGKIYDIQFIAKEPAIVGYQFTLQHQALEFIQSKKGVLAKEHLGTYEKNQGYLSVSWNRSLMDNTLTEAPTFTLVFEAKESGQLSDFLTLSNQPTLIEAYTADEEVVDVALTFTEPSTQRPFEIYQNQPNPFSENTTIGFYIPQAASVRFSIMDVSGIVVYQSTAAFEKGENQILVSRNSLPANGVLYYQLESAAGILTKTMIVID